MATTKKPTYVSPSRVAEDLNVDARTVRRWISEGRLTAVRLSARCIRIDTAEVDRFVSQAARNIGPNSAA